MLAGINEDGIVVEFAIENTNHSLMYVSITEELIKSLCSECDLTGGSIVFDGKSFKTVVLKAPERPPTEIELLQEEILKLKLALAEVVEGVI